MGGQLLALTLRESACGCVGERGREGEREREKRRKRKGREREREMVYVCVRERNLAATLPRSLSSLSLSLAPRMASAVHMLLSGATSPDACRQSRAGV
jgi:hypothetical protein